MNKILTGPPVLKVATTAGVGLIISFLLQIVQFYDHGFKSPPAALVSLGITSIGLITGYLTPGHSQPQADPQVVQISAGKVELTTNQTPRSAS